MIFDEDLTMAKKTKDNKSEVHVLTEEEARELNKDMLVLEKGVEAPFDEVIEAERQNIFKVYRSSTKRNNIIMAVVVAVFIGSFILIAQKQVWATVLGWVLVGSTLLGLVIYYLLTRNKYPNTSKKYFRTFWTASNNYLFDQEGFEKCEINLNEKYQLADVVADRVYKEVVDIASRNIVRGEYNGQTFAFGELAFYKLGQRKNAREVVFVGRHLALANSLHFEDHYIVNIKGEKNLDLPTDVDDLTKLIEEGDFIVYGPEGANPEKDLGKDTLKALKAWKVKEPLVNINVAFWAGRTAAYLSYDDNVVAIPFESPINKEAYVSLRENIKDIFAILAEKK